VANAVAIQPPIGSESDSGIVDLVRMHTYITMTRELILRKPTFQPRCRKRYRPKLVEAVAETDEALIEKYLEGEELTEAEIRQGLRQGRFGTIVPAVWLCLQKQRRPTNVGCSCRLLPAPIDVPPIQGTLPSRPFCVTPEMKNPSLALRLWLTYGRLTFIRVYSECRKAAMSLTLRIRRNGCLA